MRRATLWLVLLALPASHAHADSLDKSFPVGAGARFSLSSPATRGELVVSIAAATASRVAVECFFAAAGKELWEQFVVDVSSGAPVVAEGYLLTAERGPPERIPADALGGLDDVVLSDFLIRDRAQLDRYKKGSERVVVPASPTAIAATRYEYARGGQTLTFWLSDAAKPLGLVKLESRGDQPSQRYTLVLVALLKNVGRKIDPSKSVALTPQGRAILGTALR